MINIIRIVQSFSLEGDVLIVILSYFLVGRHTADSDLLSHLVIGVSDFLQELPAGVGILAGGGHCPAGSVLNVDLVAVRRAGHRAEADVDTVLIRVVGNCDSLKTTAGIHSGLAGYEKCLGRDGLQRGVVGNDSFVD